MPYQSSQSRGDCDLPPPGGKPAPVADDDDEADAPEDDAPAEDEVPADEPT